MHLATALAVSCAVVGDDEFENEVRRRAGNTDCRRVVDQSITWEGSDMKTVIAASILYCSAALYCVAAGSGNAAPSQEDGEFLAKAVVVSGQQATDANATARSSQRAEVKSTARSIATVHHRTQRDLENLARLKGMDLSSDGATVGQPTESVMGGSDPDRIAALLKRDEEAVALFHQEAVRGTDPEVQNYAASALPVLQQKLTVLRSLQAVYPASMIVRTDGS